MGNVNKATAVGVVAGGSSIPLIVFASQWVEAKYGIPAAVTQPLIGAVAGFFMRWAAKLHPQQ